MFERRELIHIFTNQGPCVTTAPLKLYFTGVGEMALTIVTDIEKTMSTTMSMSML